LTELGFDYLSLHSRRLHGHRYVLPVAVWIWTSGARVVGASEAMRGLDGRLDRTRAIESLARLAEIGALEELARGQQRNAARMFQRVADPYWELVSAYATAADSDRAGAGAG
jgi:6-pyruvoyl-tetrahydropterin synthase